MLTSKLTRQVPAGPAKLVQSGSDRRGKRPHRRQLLLLNIVSWGLRLWPNKLRTLPVTQAIKVIAASQLEYVV